MQDKSRKPVVWYVAAGYLLPAGIEAYLLHYATELRNQGFDTRIVVFQPLPRVEHRFLKALRERNIPIESLYEQVRWQARVLTAVAYVPWVLVRSQKSEVRSQKADAHQAPSLDTPILRYPHTPTRLCHHFLKHLAVRLLARMIRKMKPNIVHVKGRVITEAWPIFPPERTIYQHTLMGTVDPSWEPQEVEVFSAFLNRCAGILVQGEGIARTFAESFKVNRPIDVVPTMVPDDIGAETGEAGTAKHAEGAKAENLSQRHKGTEEERIVHESHESTPMTNAERLGEPAARSPGGEAEGAQTSLQPPPLPLRGAQPGCAGCSASDVGHAQGPDIRVNSCNSWLRNSAVDRTGASLRFGIICRFTEQKGITFILEALKMFREKHGGVHFVFAGQGPLEGMIREWIRDQKSEVRRQKTEDGGGTATDGTDEECVATDGHRRHGRPARGRPSSSGGKPAHHTADLWAGSPPESVCVSGREDSDSSIRVMPVRSAVEVLKDLDVFVHPGLDDAMPVSIVEALMCGVPVIGSSVGATPELVRDGVEGFIVSPSDAGAIFEAMDRFAAMGASELARFRQAARARYEEKCTPARVGGQVAAIYRGVMEACR